MRQPNEATSIFFYHLCLDDRCISQLLAAHNVTTQADFCAFLDAVRTKLCAVGDPGTPGGEPGTPGVPGG